MRIHHLNGGTLRPPGGRLVDGKGGLLHRAEMVCHCVLIETDTGLVLIETGVGTPTAKDPVGWLGKRFVGLVNPVADEEQTTLRQVERLGFTASDVRHIVLTHLDLDHAGGLVDFPDATVHVHAAELESMHNASGAERLRYRSVQFAHEPKFSAHDEAGEPWFGFDAVRDLPGLPPEVLLIPLAGHTRGHTGVAVDTGDGWLLHAGDAYFHPGQLDPAGAHMPLGMRLFERIVQTDKPARVRNLQRLRELARDHAADVDIFCAHNPDDLRRAMM